MPKDLTPEQMIAQMEKQIAELRSENSKLSRDLDAATKNFQDAAKLAAQIQISSGRELRAQDSHWENDSSIKGRFMHSFILTKDTGSKQDDKSMSNALDIVLWGVYQKNKLNHDQHMIKFADGYYHINDIQISSLFSGLLLPPEISDDFDSAFARRFKPDLVLDYGVNFLAMSAPTKRAFDDSNHMIKAWFKYYQEQMIPMSNFHQSINIYTAMKECAHESRSGVFYVARRDQNQYQIPYFIPDLNDQLVWKDEYYTDNVDIYVNNYFNIYVYNLLRGKAG